MAGDAVGHSHGEDDRRRDEGRECQEELVVASAAGHLDDRADPGKAHIRDVAAVELEQRQPATGVVEVCRSQPITDETDVFEGFVSLGDDLTLLGRIIGVNGDHATERRVAIRDEVDRAVDRRDVFVSRVGLVEDGPHACGLDAIREVGDVDPTLRTRSRHDGDDEEATIVGDLGLEDPVVLGRDREDQLVVRRIRPESVIAQLHVEVRGVVGGVARWLRVAAIEEARAIVRPGSGREFAPFDPVGQLVAGVDAADSPAAPVRTGTAQAKRDRPPSSDTATAVSAVVPSPLSAFGSIRTLPMASAESAVHRTS